MFRAAAPLAIACAALLATAACGTSYVSAKSTAAPALIAEAHSPAEVRAAVIRALSEQRFTTEGEEPGSIRARFERGDERFSVRVDYSGTEFAVHYRESVGYEVFPAEGGDTLIESRYGKLVTKLKKAVERELRRPAEEAAQREAEERQYQLLLEQARSGGAQPAGASQPAQPAEPAPLDAAAAIGGEVIQRVVPAGGVSLEQSGSVRRSEQSLECTINGVTYACPGQAAFDRCVKLSPDQCTRKK